MSTQNEGFHGLGIAPKFLEILKQKEFLTPTPIQEQAIPIAIEGKDVIGIAQTGTGKTLAFGIPMLQRMVAVKGDGLVIVPTRELAIQVDESLQQIGQRLGLKTAVLIGGEDFKRQVRKLKQNPHVIIATPGRLIDHLEQRTVKLVAVKILVLDEADRMLDMGFAPQVSKILQSVPKDRQTMLFSATMPQEIVALASSYMKKPTRVEVAPAGTAAKDVSQELFFVEKHNKPALLEELLKKYSGSVLVFTRTKYEAKKVSRVVRNTGHTSAELHSNRSLSQRKEALQGFKMGKYRVLVATDIAARGIDVSGIELVVNYDLPANAEDYVHRIGRTGRAGLSGHAISFAMTNQRHDVKSIERMLKKVLPVSKHNVSTAYKPEPRESKPAPSYSKSQSSYSPNRKPGARHGKSQYKTPPYKSTRYVPKDEAFTPYSAFRKIKRNK